MAVTRENLQNSVFFSINGTSSVVYILIDLAFLILQPDSIKKIQALAINQVILANKDEFSS